jgi:hypothetical protein
LCGQRALALALAGVPVAVRTFAAATADDAVAGVPVAVRTFAAATADDAVAGIPAAGRTFAARKAITVGPRRTAGVAWFAVTDETSVTAHRIAVQDLLLKAPHIF